MSNETRSATVNLCANCGKGEESVGDLKACTACKMVKYCNRDCQIAHRPQHKKECKKRAAELYEEALFRDPPPPEDCPICMLPLPLDAEKYFFKLCCGKVLCFGCIVSMTIEETRKGKKKEHLCPYCRSPHSDEGQVEQYKNLMEKGNAMAFFESGCYYARGTNGMRQDWVKANELWLKAGELGCAQAYFNLGSSYYHGMGVEIDKKKAEHYWEPAAMNGDVYARHNLGALEGKAGNHERAMKHFMVAARAGDNKSLDKVKQGFMRGFVTKDEYGNALRAYQERQDEMKSDTREAAAS